MEERRQEYPQLLKEIADIKTQLTTLCDFINGNGQVGLKVRMDRLEQSEKSRLWTHRMVFGSVMGLVLKAAFDLVAK